MFWYAAPYFLRPYQNSPSEITRVIDGSVRKVYRPNHSLAHSMRQGFLALDVVMCLKNSITKYYLQSDNLFLTKLWILSSFQRSGRESEISSSQNPTLYRSYEDADVKNFLRSAPVSYFTSQEEMRKWSEALRWSSDTYLAKILKVAHQLDLRRIPHFSKERILEEIKKELGLSDAAASWLWSRSGEYIQHTGDRSMEPKQEGWNNRFFLLHVKPQEMFDGLESRYRGKR